MDARLSFHTSPVFVPLTLLNWKQLIVMLSSSTGFSVDFFFSQFVDSLNNVTTKSYTTVLTSCSQQTHFHGFTLDLYFYRGILNDIDVVNYLEGFLKLKACLTLAFITNFSRLS